MARQGQFSVVYKAKRTTDGEIVALKKIAMAKMDEKEQTKCLKEVRLLESLDHQGIIKYEEAFIEDSELVIVCEWASGGDLRRLMRRANEEDPPKLFQEVEVWEYILQVTSAIKYMHERRIMHRDIKPANVLIMGNGQLKVADLGLGRFFSDQTMEAFSKVGTPVYMSPEALHGKGYDFKSDVWSLGCLLYELATLRTPFKNQGDNLYAIFKRINDCQYEPLPERCSVSMRQLVDSILRTDPASRPDIVQLNAIALQEAQKAAARSKAPSAGAGGGGEQLEDASGAAGRITEWLKVLGWEGGYLRPRGLPTPPRHLFAVANAIGRGSGAERLRIFLGVCGWLLEKAGHRLDGPLEECDAAEGLTNLIGELGRKGLKNDYALPALKRGYGKEACEVLESLCGLASQAAHGWKAPVRQVETEAEEIPERDEELDEGPQVAEEEEAEEEPDLEPGEQRGGRLLEVITPSIEPEAWRQEAARAAQGLSQRAQSGARKGYSEFIAAMLPIRKSIVTGVAASQASLAELSHAIADELERARTKEERIQAECSHTIGSYEQSKRTSLESEAEYKGRAAEVETLAGTLSDLAEELDLAKDAMQERQGGVEDASPVVTLKQTLKKMKEESTQLTLRIGVAKQLLASKQLRARQEGLSLGSKRVDEDDDL